MTGSIKRSNGLGGDTLACAAAMTMTSFTAMSRMASDKHYFSDIFVGGALGSFSGALMPFLLYYQFDVMPAPSAQSFVMPFVNDEQVGVSYSGLF